MITVSSDWKAKQQGILTPESFVEITCAFTESGIQEQAVASSTEQEIFSDMSNVTGVSSTQTITRYATFEPNLWRLDGTMSILPDVGPYSNTGYVSFVTGGGSLRLTLPEVHTESIPGVTILWSSEYGEYATKFQVIARNGDSTVAETVVLDNTSNRSLVPFEIANYDSVEIIILEWSIPNHRPRVDTVWLGLVLVFTKKEILSYTHEQSGCILSGELPKNCIEFSIDNSDNRWNPNNPQGMEQYLSERQKLTVRYGLDIDGTIEWTKAGTFYLSEWKAPSNGLEASFVARDLLEFMINVPYTGIREGTLAEIVDSALEQAKLPLGAETLVMLGEWGENYTATLPEGDYTIAEVLQLCANACGCAMFQDREGKLRIQYKGVILSDYVISSDVAYSWPEIELTKRLKNVEVSYGDGNKWVLEVNESGETQTVDNPLISIETHAAVLADTVMYQLRPRQALSGEFRADPRLDLFDCIEIDTKFGRISPVIVSNIKYTYSGAFRGSYTVKVWEGTS